MSSPPLTTIYNPDKKQWVGTLNDGSIFDRTMSYDQTLLKELEKYPDVVIQINHDTGNRMTCKEMLLKVKKIAENLKKLNIQIGDFVTIAAEHHENLVPIYLGVLAVGAVVNPLHSGFTVLEFNHFLEMIKPKLIICDGCITDTITKSLKTVNHSALMYTFLQSNDPSIKLVDELFNEFDTNPANYVAPNLGDLSKALAFILCSSGTTGPPKGVVISHGMALGGLVLRGIFPEGSATFNTSSLYWLTSLTTIASAIVCRSPRVITAKPITQQLLLEILEKHRVLSLFTAPVFVIEIANGLETAAIKKWDLSNLRVILSAGSTISENTIITMQKLLPTATVLSTYGITDAGGGVACQINTKKIKSVGSLIPETVAKIVSNDGNQISLQHNEIGEVWIKKPFPFMGYLKNEEGTKNGYDLDGWHHTGDLGYFDNDNELFLVDREKDIFKYRNYQVTPGELEAFIEKTFAGVKEIVIVGIPDEKVTALPAAAIVLHENVQVTKNDISKAIEENFSDAKRLRGGVYFVNDLPRTKTGKFLRILIRNTVCELYNQKNNK